MGNYRQTEKRVCPRFRMRFAFSQNSCCSKKYLSRLSGIEPPVPIDRVTRRLVSKMITTNRREGHERARYTPILRYSRLLAYHESEASVRGCWHRNRSLVAKVLCCPCDRSPPLKGMRKFGTKIGKGFNMRHIATCGISGEVEQFDLLR